MLPLGQIICSHNIYFHCYADDTQLCVPLKPAVNDLSSIMSFLSDIKCWMSNNFLQLNNSKSEIIIIIPPGLKYLCEAQMTTLMQSCFFNQE
ncbi:hypothetical protein LDENG_00133160 [Lucifuga dentata]|nr:hypothetical protein LDENG_00133160 [Lucifuga dentata]